MKGRKRFCEAVVLFLCLASCIALAPKGGMAQGLRVPRVISVVYDDSSSMDDGLYTGLGKAQYANYAMKAFLALLDKDDVLYVTFMSDPVTPHRLDLSNGAPAAIAQLDAHLQSGMTPYQTVQTAMDALRREPAPNDDSMYWLVIFTDGEFDWGTLSTNQAADIDTELRSFLQLTMPNGTLPQVCYLAIGGGAARPMQAQDGLTVYPATGTVEKSEDIIAVMRAMADRISGRARLDESKVVFSGTTVRFTTDLPCFSMALLKQETDDPWIKITDPDGKEISGSKVSIETVSSYGVQTLKGLAGKIDGGPGGVLPAGTYELTFSREPGDVVIMTEPALVLDLHVTANGTGAADDLSLIQAGKADVQGTLHLFNDSAPVDAAMLPAGTSYTVKAAQGGAVIAQTSNAAMRIEDVDIAAADTLISGTVELPGIGTVTANRLIHLPVYSLAIRREDSGSFSLRELLNNTQGIVATVCRDGEPLSPGEAAGLDLKVASLLPLQVERTDAGAFRIVPSLDTLHPLDSYGDMAATLTIEGGTGKIEPAVVQWHVQKPVITVESAYLGTDTMVRTDLWKSESLLKDIHSPGDFQEAAKTQVVASFRVLMDGKQLSGAELAQWGGVSVGLTGGAMEHCLLDTASMEDGTILAAPYYPSFDFLSDSLWHWLDSWRLWAGEGAVRCAVAGEAAGDVPFSIIWEPWYVLLLHWGVPLLLLAILLGFAVKRRFARGAAVRYVSISKSANSLVSGADMWHEEKLGRFNIWSLVPYAKARSMAGGLMFFAGRSGCVLVRQDALPRDSALIAQKFCTCRGGFAMDAENKERRAVHMSQQDTGAGRYCVLARNDMLVSTGDGRSGRAFIYDQKR